VIALLVGLTNLVAVAVAVGVHRAKRDVLRETSSHRQRGARFVVRIDPPRLPLAVQGAFWALLGVSVVGIALPAWSFSREAVTAMSGLSWLVAVGGLAAVVGAYDRGLLWPAPTQRLGLTDELVWWDQVDPRAQQELGPTSAARRTRRRDATLEQDGPFAVIRGPDGRGTAFGPLSPRTMQALRDGWVS